MIAMRDDDLGPYWGKPVPPERKRGGSVPDLGVVAVAAAVAIVAGIGGYSMALDDNKATSAATVASRPATATVTVAKMTVTATISVAREPREKTAPMPTVIDLPGKYAVGKDIKAGQWVSLTANLGCKWTIYGADGKVRDYDHLYINTGDDSTTAEIQKTDTVFEFEPGCAPFELTH